jgi:hypothetical protein
VDRIDCGPGPADVLAYTGPVDLLDIPDGCEIVTFS